MTESIKTYSTEKSEVIFTADDGTEFSSKSECLEYEKSTKCILGALYSRLRFHTTNIEEVFSCESEENQLDIFLPKTIEEVKIILQYAYIINGTHRKDLEDGVMKAYENQDPVFIGWNYDGDSMWLIGNKSSLIERIEKCCVKESNNEQGESCTTTN